jgi:hypothetical protein
MCFSKYCSMPKMVEFHREISYMRVPVKCETKRNEIKQNETKQNEMKRNETDRNEM